MKRRKGKNQFGLDARYFHEKLSQLVRDIDHYTPAELRRALSRLADTAECRTLAAEPIPEGYRLVPVEPNDSQLHKAYDNCMMHLPYTQSTCHALAANIYKAMIEGEV